jgi:hypothetical protein
MCRAPAAPTPPSLCATCLPAPVPPLPTPHWLSPRFSTLRRCRPSRHASRRLGSTCSRATKPSSGPRARPEAPTHSPLLSRVCISTTLLFPELSTSPDLRRSYCSSSTAAAAAAHPRSSARVAPRQPTKAHKPAQFHSPTLDRPDHSAGELELHRRSASPSSQRSTAS